MIEQLHLYFPGARIDFLLKNGIQSLFEGHPFLNEVLVWDKSQRKYSNYIKILNLVRKRRYDLVVNIHRFFTSGLIAFFSGAGAVAGFDKNPMSWAFTYQVKHIIGTRANPFHEVERNLILIRELTGPGQVKPKLYPAESDVLAVHTLMSKKFITISPASLWFTKQLPKNQWVELIRAFEDDFSIYLLGGKADRSLCDEIIQESGKAYTLNLAGELTFLQSAALMERAMMNYVNDSAPMHLASAVNAPVTAVFCSTVPYFGFGPLSDKSFIAETNDDLPCRPCGLHGKMSCPEQHFRCATSIQTRQLLSTIQI